MRCLTLAHTLRRRGAHCSFICRVHDGDLTSLVSAHGFDLRLLHGRTIKELESVVRYDSWLGVSWEHDAEQTTAVLREHGEPDWLVVDHYGLDARWEERIAEQGISLLAIDDIADRRHHAAMLLDQNYFPAAEERYRPLVNDDCVLLLGPDYALLRDEFLQITSPRERDGVVRRILIFFGGMDQPNLTTRALKAISHLCDNNQLQLEDVTVVIGANNQFADQIRSAAQKIPHTRLLQQVDTMAELMNQADLAIGGGGTTTWERAWLGLPSLTVLLAENQRPMTEAVADTGAAINLGWHEQVSSMQIAQVLTELAKRPARLRSLSNSALRLYGDRSRPGVERVADRLLVKRHLPRQRTPIVGVGEEIP